MKIITASGAYDLTMVAKNKRDTLTRRVKRKVMRHIKRASLNCEVSVLVNVGGNESVTPWLHELGYAARGSAHGEIYINWARVG